MVRIKKNKRFDSFNKDGKENGFVVPIIDVMDSFLPDGMFPHQVYLTVVNPGEVKGPHFHKIRYAMYTCVKGNVKVVTKSESGYQIHFSGEDYEYATIWIAPGIPTAIINLDPVQPSYVINTPNPSYLETPDDDHHVVFEDEMLKV